MPYASSMMTTLRLAAGMLFTAIMVCSAFFALPLAAGAAPAEDKPLPVCYRCHKKQMDGKNVHPVVKTKGCIACHTNPHSAKHKATKFLPATGTELCFLCHDKAKFTKKIQHPPVAAGDCQSCHEVHVSENSKLLTAKMPDLCFNCHDKAKFENKSTHPPVAAGECISCHDPHSSDTEKLLIADTPELCYTCHDKKKFRGKKRRHLPVRYGYCASCHNPHASPYAKLLIEEPPALCFNCHDEDNFKGKKVIHSPVEGGLCGSCHAPHQSSFKRLLLSKRPNLCFGCHDDKMFSQRNIHPPVERGRCNACHSPHASNMKALLPKEVNALCHKCHKKIGPSHISAGISRKGHPVRTDRERLVDGKRIKLSCISCHDPHSTNTIKLFKFPVKSAMELCINCHKK
ncbi:MAG: hypothetical protein EPN25_11120 [Nitrospirae bacterium]|nr:MAG: hypothetical protein EPN25_11120 [Nitrospirota bacterium]